MNWRNSYSFLILAVLVFGCSATNSNLSPVEKKTAEETEIKSKLYHRYESKYDWAVQHYEAGQYDEAIKSLKELSKDGTVVSAFQNIPFYLGMSYFYKENNTSAIAELEKLLQSRTDPMLLQEAQMHLLMLYEKQSMWGKLAALSIEVDKSNLYQNNRILLKLLWANALLEQNELLGAKQALTEGETLLNNQPPVAYEPETNNETSDLWGRFYFTDLKSKLRDCSSLNAKELKLGKKRKEKLIVSWIDASTNCYYHAEKSLVEKLMKSQSSWIEPSTNELIASLSTYAKRLLESFQDQKLTLKTRHEYAAKSRESLYFLLHYTEQAGKDLESQPLTKNMIRNLQKQVDHLIYSLAIPSS